MNGPIDESFKGRIPRQLETWKKGYHGTSKEEEKGEIKYHRRWNTILINNWPRYVME
jgi:hypothetical protein